MSTIQEGEVLFDARASAVGSERSHADALRDAVSLTLITDIADAERPWRTFETFADCTAFQAYAWHAAWQRHIGAAAGVLPAIIVGRARGRVAFIFPLAVERSMGVRRLVWHASALCDYNAPLLAPDFVELAGGDFAALFGKVVETIAAAMPFDAVLFTKMPDTVGRQKNPFLALGTTLNPSAAYLANLGKDWEAYYAARRPSAKRKRDRNKRRRLGDAGVVTFATAESDADLAANLTTLLDQKGKAFASMGVYNFLAQPDVRAFFNDIATSPDTRQFIHLSRLDINGQMAATNLGLVFRNRYYHVLASYDAGPVSKYGPGAVHLLELLAYAIKRGCEAFDFTIGDEPYKREWSDVVIALHDYRSSVTLRGFLAGLPDLALSQAKRMIKQNKVLWRLAVKARAMLAGNKSSEPGTESSEEDGNSAIGRSSRGDTAAPPH